MSTLLFFISSFLGAISFLFIFWKRMKEDYSSTLIFSAAFTTILACLLGAAITIPLSAIFTGSSLFAPSEIWVWGVFLGAILSSFYQVKNGFKKTETIEAELIGFIVWLVLVYLAGFLASGELSSLILFIITLLLSASFLFFESRYRQFSWYKSGRVGFSGLLVAALYFSTRSIAVVIDPTIFSLAGRIDILFSSVTAFILFVSLYNLAEG